MKCVSIAGDGSFRGEVVGESHYSEALFRLADGKEWQEGELVLDAVLIPEDTNRHDKNAVQVTIKGALVGYLDRTNARRHRKRLAAEGYAGWPATCKASIIGGFEGEPIYGVRLDISEFHDLPKKSRAKKPTPQKTKVGLMKWEVSGAWKADGAEASMVVEAPN